VTRKDPILVVGGGLDGASIALALARRGFRVRLLDQGAAA
jgi:2-polyprenyl-6-methoxyphenol hydroxylase-like FAD-dependent oxidoreductase